jgi:hypothetical protein
MTGVTEDHLTAFGAVAYNYAIVENEFKKILSAMIDADPKIVIIMADPYSAVSLRKVLKSVARELHWPDDQFSEFCCIVGESKPFGFLRNHIAHSQWRPGARAGSIKPIGLDIKLERARLFGDKSEEVDYTAKEIMEVAKNIEKLQLRIAKFCKKYGLYDNIRDKIRKARALAASSMGEG